MIEVTGQDIKLYVSSFRSCNITNLGYTLWPINSNIVFDFNSFEGKLKIEFSFKRLSGNGRCIIDKREINVLSKTLHKTELELSSNGSKLVEIYRDEISTGKVLINAISIYRLDLEDNVIEVVDRMPNNWKSILSRCGSVKGIKLINGKLMAVEGASIQKADIIDYIETDPVKACILGEGAKFAIPCQILNIQLKPDIISDVSSTKLMYKNMKHPAKISSKPSSTIGQTIVKNEFNIPIPGVDKVTGSQNNIVLFDSYITGLNPATLQNSSEITSGHGNSGKGLLLGRYAGFGIPVSSIEPNIQYVIVVKVKKINGNGKLGLCFAETDGSKRARSIFICPNRETELFIKLNSGEAPKVGSSYLLEIFRPDNSTVGEVIIDRIMIIRGIFVYSPINIHEINKKFSTDSKNSTIDSFSLSNTLGGFDSIALLTKQYARWTSHTKSDLKFDKNTNFVFTTSSGLSWYSKIKNICPNITLKNKKNVSESDVVFAELGSLVPCQKLWLDVFDGNLISEEDDDILSKTSKIFSPSLQNVNLLKTRYPSVNVIHQCRIWPMISDTKIVFPEKDYIFYIHRHNDLTKCLIDSWSKDMLRLVVVGYRGSLPNFVIPMNEYIPYDSFLGILQNAKAVIDLPYHDDYESGFLSLVFDYGIPAVTSNWFGFNKNKSKFLISYKNENSSDVNLPNIDELKENIEYILNISHSQKNIHEHNDKFINFLEKLI